MAHDSHLGCGALLQSIGRLRSESLTATIQFHLTLMNFAVARLSINSLDRRPSSFCWRSGIEPFSWADCSFFARLWRGQHVEELVLWHDQGYGDAIQNLAWMGRSANAWIDCDFSYERRCCELFGKNVFTEELQVEVMDPLCPPGSLEPHLGLWFMPLMLGGWGLINHRCSGVRCPAAAMRSTSLSSLGLDWFGWRVAIKHLSQSWQPVCAICLSITYSNVYGSEPTLSSTLFQSSA